MRQCRAACLAAMIALPVCLIGCISVLAPPDAPDAFYRIGPMEPVHRLGAPVAVREPEASRVFAGRAIAVEGSDGAMRVLRRIQWTDSATRMMQVALLDTLGGEAGNAALAAEAGAEATYELVWRISDFTLAGTMARCRLEATLLADRSRRVAASTTVSTSAVALDTSDAARVRALTDAGRACLSELAAFIAAASQPTD